MESCEIVRKAIEFDLPERVPIVFTRDSDDDSCMLDYGTLGSGAKFWKPLRVVKDEWGCVWGSTEQDNMGQVKEHPLKNWDAMKNYKFPDPNVQERFANLENLLRDVSGKYVILNCPFSLFERMHYLHGFTELLQDFYLYPKEVHELAERVLSFQIGIIRGLNKFRGKVHGILMTDDWGTQESTIISLPLWREFFKSRYKRLFTAIHNAGMHAWLHSCGKINDFVGEFIDVGLNVINFGQPTLVGIEEIGNSFAGKICFANCIDIQTTLPFGTLDEIKAEAKLLIEKWGTLQGGFIAMAVLEPECIGVSKDRINVLVNAFKEGNFKRFGGAT